MSSFHASAIAAVAVIASHCSADTTTIEPTSASDDVVACARLSACTDFEKGTVRGYDACRGGWYGLDAVSSSRPRVLDCVIGAEDCEGALRCIHAEGACQDATPRCDGEVLHDCFSGVAVARDCAAEGLDCIDNGKAYCGRRGPCSETTCEEDRLFLCPLTGEDVFAIDCAPGLCHIDGRIGRCLPSRQPCERGDNFCDGDVANTCSDGWRDRVRCLPGQCRDTDGAFCREEEFCASTCDGTALMACTTGGRRERIDCTAWGSSGCILDEGGARCAP